MLSSYVAGLLTLSLDRKRKRRDIYVREIKSSEFSLRLEGTKKLARLLEADPRIGDLTPEDIRVLIGFLKHQENPELQFYALYALTNVDADGGKLIKTEGLPFLVRLMKSKSTHTKMQVLITLGRITYDFPASTEYLCENGTLKALQNIVVKYKYDDIMLLNCSTFLAIVCRGFRYDYGYRPHPREVAKVYHILNFLRQRGRWYEELLPDVLVAILYMSDSVSSFMSSSYSSRWGFGRKACTVYVDLMSDADPLIVVCVLQVILKSMRTASASTKWMLERGLMQRLYSLSNHKYKVVRFHVIWILTKIVQTTNKTHGDFEIVEHKKWPNFFSVIKDLVTCQQIDFADPEDDFPVTVSVSIGPFCDSPNIHSIFDLFSEGSWLAEIYTQKKFLY